MSANLWLRIVKLLERKPPMTAAAIAQALSEERDRVSAYLRAYAQRGRLVRVVLRDHPRLHWRLSARDPRRDPIAGDVLRVANEARAVTQIMRLRNGALHRVCGTANQVWFAQGWRQWATAADVLKRGKEVGHEA